jgi:hypothetical protein
VITSPPYADSIDHAPGNKAWVGVRRGNLAQEDYGTTPGQLGVLPQGDADSVLTSPPYAASVHGRNGIALGKCDRSGAHTQAGAQGYGEAPGNVGNLAAGDAGAVVTSPPWEDGGMGDARPFGGMKTPVPRTKNTGGGGLTDYGTAPGQVGALRQETYWSAMAVIWQQAYLALRPNGVLCAVLKDFVRAKKRVPLCDQTWRLLLSLGFTPVERIRCLLSEETREPSLFGGVEVRRKSRESFFRRLSRKRGTPEIPWEEILVVRKGSERDAES